MTGTAVLARPPVRTPRSLRLSDVVLLALVLATAAAYIGRGNFTIDESAYRAQAAWVDEDGTWLQPSVVPDLGPGAEPAPLANAVLSDRGWAAYGKAPLYIVLLVAARQVDPVWGPVGLSIVGLVLLCVATGRLSERLAPGSGRSAFWLLGLASPFFLHGLIVWAHTLMAAAVAAALLAVTPARDADRLRSTLVGAACLALAVLLRAEAVVLGAAVVGVGLLELLRGATGAAFRLTVPGIGGTIGGHAVNGLLAEALVGAGATRTAPASHEFVEDRLQSLWNNVLSPGWSWHGPIAARLASVVLLAGVALHLRSRRNDRPALPLLVALGVVLGVVGAGAGVPYPALLPAVPLFAVGILGVLGAEQLEPGHRRLATLAALFTAATVLISEPGGGGLGWGGRYVMVATVIVAPLAAVGLRRLVGPAGGMGAGLVLAAVLVTGAIQVNGLLLLRWAHANSVAKAEQVETDLGELAGRGDLMLTTDIGIGRSAPHTARRLPLLTVPPDDVLALLDRIEAARLEPPLLVGSRLNPPQAPGRGWVIGPVEELEYLVVAPLTRTSTPSGDGHRP